MSAKKLSWKLYRRMLRKVEHRLEPYRRPRGWFGEEEEEQEAEADKGNLGVAGRNVRLAAGLAEREGAHLPGCAANTATTEKRP